MRRELRELESHIPLLVEILERPALESEEEAA